MNAATQYLHTPDGIRLAYVDFQGPGRPVLALHGAYGRGRSFGALAAHLGPRYRLIAVDQRGHGRSDHPGDYSRAAFLADAEAVIDHLGLAPAVLIGHSLGGINAYQLAARRPDLVAAAVIADFPAVRPAGGAGDGWIAALPARFPTLAALRTALAPADGFGAIDHFTESAFEDEDGWGFLWNAGEVGEATAAVRGEWWDDWTGGSQPVLLVRGADSPLVPPEHAAEMARRRPGTEVVTLDGAGHDFYLTHTARFAEVTRHFLDRLPRP